MKDIKNNVIIAQDDDNAIAIPVRLTKRIGSTTYVVAVHFSRTDKETIEDKLYRLIEQEVENAA